MSLADELQKLQQLHASGAITDEEFQQAKARQMEAPEAPEDTLVEDAPLDPEEGSEAEREEDARQWAFFLHLSQYAYVLVPLAGVLLPITLWQMKKREFPVIDAHGKNVMNWILSLFIYTALAIPLSCLLVGIPLAIVVAIVAVIYPIVGAIKANQGQVWTYPGTIPFLK